MKLTTYIQPSEDYPRLAAILDDGRLVDLGSTHQDLPSCIMEFAAVADDALIALAEKQIPSGTPFSADEVQLLPPVPAPSKILCVGLNYADHAAETGADIPDRPVIFNKLPGTLSQNGAPIVIPRVSDKIDYEAELVVVIGREGRYISEDDAMDHVFGYCCGNDVSARDWQKGTPAGQWLLGKSFDTFAPIGPHVVTKNEIADPNNLLVRSILGDEVMQESSTSQFLYPIPRLISYISQVCTLEPGDLILTGTPPGVGFARSPQVFMKPGDTITVEIEGIGKLTNPVVSED